MNYEPKNVLTEKDKQIANAQAWNLAVALLGGRDILPLVEDIEMWQSIFYTKLTEPNEKLVEKMNKTRGVDTKKSGDVGHLDAVEDMIQEV